MGLVSPYGIDKIPTNSPSSVSREADARRLNFTIINIYNL